MVERVSQVTTDRYINPFTDFGFKRLFGEEPSKDILMGFLNALLAKETGTITELTYLKNEQLGALDIDRKAIFDIYCENEDGEKFIVEMQKAKHNYFKERSIYYATFPIREQAEKGEWDYDLKAVYTIGILDFVFDEDRDDPEKMIYKVKLSDIDTNKVFYDKLTFIYLEMPKFDKQEEELETNFDKWLYVLKNLPLLFDRPKRLQEKVFEKLFEVAEIANFSRKQLDDYEESLKVYRDMKGVLDTAREEGREEGRKEGIFDTCRKALRKDIPPETVAEITGLSLKKVLEIKKSL
ncbi:MAG: Rpn family recombination-promoting nuclease/putative transposase [bacterium]